MKKILRKQAMHRGVRAVELGLKTEDLEAIEEAAAETGLSANETSIIQVIGSSGFIKSCKIQLG